MCFAALKGRDAHLVRRAHLAAEALGLCLGLAILTLTLQGPYGEDGGWSDSSEFQRDIERGSWVKYLVDLEGHVVSDRLRFTNDLKGEMMPTEWRERLERVRFDKYEPDNYVGNHGVGEKRCK